MVAGRRCAGLPGGPGRATRDALDAVAQAWRGREGPLRRRDVQRCIPSPVALARFVCGCRDRGLAFKATAGLHHPLREGIVHGFPNLLGAAVLAHARRDERDLAEVLAGGGRGRVRRRRRRCSPSTGTSSGRSKIAATREGPSTGYGSCSFSEPVEDLRRLRIL